ncbi:MAG: HAMP domain-containing histidine kinase [Anaerolineae bacterium]|nr:HAMP domain-containing histidine kinase [Anaerolineae bacterium]
MNDLLKAQVAERVAELCAANEALQCEIRERERVERLLRERTAELEARNQELDAFARTVAHDLKSPLALLVNLGELAALCLDDHDFDGMRESVTRMVRTGHKLASIVEALLLLATTRQQGEIEIVPLDMAEIVRGARARLEAMIKKHRAEVICPQEWPSAMGHGPWVEAVWTNYLSNAIRYGQPGHNGARPQVTLGADHQVTYRDGVPMVRFWVRDDGPGLAPEEQARLFAEFQQLGNGHGHGLGLSIVRRITDRLGSEVGVESAPGQGSLFYFSLPAANGH